MFDALRAAEIMTIEQAHVIDDLQQENHRLRRAIRTAQSLLVDVPHMIDNDRGAVAVEHIDRALIALQDEVTP